VALWAGGELTRRIRARLPGVALVPELAATVDLARDWRAQAGEAGESPAPA
jgi:hypothetical protein